MKLEWKNPSIQVQEFEPNEYVAVCWGVSCSVEAANNVEKSWTQGFPKWVNGKWCSNNYDAGQTHASDHCGKLTNQWVIDDNNDGIVDRMIETGTDGLGNLTCRLTNSTYSSTASFNGVEIGSYIYWTTSADNRTWHHQGKVIGTDSSHPNRS